MEKVKKAALSVLAALAIICLTVGFMFSLPAATAYADEPGSNVSTDTDTGTGSGEGTGEGSGEGTDEGTGGNTETEPTEPTVTEEAAIGETKYPTLQAAIEAAAEEATVTMLKDVTVAGSITITKPINFDLNGYTLTGTATGTEAAETLKIYASKQIDVKVYSSKEGGMIEHATYSAVWACREAHVTFKDLTIKGATPFTAEGASVGGAVTVGSSDNSGTGTPFGTFEKCTIIDEKGNGICVLSGTDSTYTNISVNDSTINAGLYGIVGNGAENKTRINLTNTTITSDAVGIYNPQYTSELTVNGGSITGVNSAIEIRAGELTITGDAKLTATATSFSAASNTSGTTVVGAALAVSQHTNNKSIDVIIESGTFTGVKAVYEGDLEDERTTNVSMTIVDGAFEGEVESENVESFITGGDFAKKIDVSYITGAVLYSTGTAESERYAVGTVAEAKEAGVTTIVDGYGYKAGDTVPELTEPAASFVSDGVTAEFSTLQAAVTVAVNGETVTLLKDVTENIVVPADNKLTLDLNGNTITSVAPTSLAKGIDNKGDLTITDTSEDQTGTVVMTGNALASLLQSAGTDEDLASLTIKAGNYTGGRLITSNQSSLTIEDGTFTSSATGHSVLTSGTCTVTISGGEFTNSNTSCTGGLISIMSTGSHVISGGTFTSANGQVVSFSARNSTLDITGGEFIDSGSADAVLINKGGSGTLTVSGGEFSEAISSDYIEEGIVLIPDADGGYVTKEESALTAEDCVALIDSIGYKTLNDAILAADEGATIKLMADITSDATVLINKNVVLDLNRFTATSTASSISYANFLYVKNATNITIKNGTIVGAAGQNAIFAIASNLTLDNVTIDAGKANAVGIVFYGTTNISAIKGDGATTRTAVSTEGFYTLNVNNSTVQADVYGIAGNGGAENSGTIININNSTVETLTQDHGTAIFHPQYGILNVDGANTVIEGLTGIEMRAGELNVYDGTITSTLEEPLLTDPNPREGNSVYGAAVAISQHTTQLPVDVNVSGGTLGATYEGNYALYEIDLIEDAGATGDKDIITISLTGGTYNGEVYSENKTGFVSGGKFSEELDASLFVEGFSAQYLNGYYYALEESGSEGSGSFQTSKLEAQTDIRLYATSALGMSWTKLQTVAGAQEIIDLYNAIENATGVGALTIAKTEAMNAVDAYLAAVEAARAEAVAAVYDKAEEAGVTLPTAAYAAINGALTTEEVEMYQEYAEAEIAEIKELRADISSQMDELQKVSSAVNKLSTAFTGTNNEFDALLKDIEDAIDAAQKEIVDGTSDSLTKMQAALETKISAGDKAIESAIATLRTELSNYAAKVDTVKTELQASLTASTGALQTGVDALDEAIGAVQADIDALEAAIDAEGGNVEDLAADIAGVKTAVDGISASVESVVEDAQAALSQQIEDADDSSAFTVVYTLVGIALALAAAAVVLQVVTLFKRK